MRKKVIRGRMVLTAQRFTPEMYDAVRRIALEESRTSSSVIRQAVAAFLAQRKKGERA
jgi:predicted transcriptional regulator